MYDTMQMLHWLCTSSIETVPGEDPILPQANSTLPEKEELQTQYCDTHLRHNKFDMKKKEL